MRQEEWIRERGKGIGNRGWESARRGKDGPMSSRDKKKHGDKNRRGEEGEEPALLRDPGSELPVLITGDHGKQ